MATPRPEQLEDEEDVGPDEYEDAFSEDDDKEVEDLLDEDLNEDEQYYRRVGRLEKKYEKRLEELEEEHMQNLELEDDQYQQKLVELEDNEYEEYEEDARHEEYLKEEEERYRLEVAKQKELHYRKLDLLDERSTLTQGTMDKGFDEFLGDLEDTIVNPEEPRKPRRKMAPGITLDDSPEKTAPPTRDESAKRRKMTTNEYQEYLETLQKVLEQEKAPTMAQEEELAEELQGSLVLPIDDDDDDPVDFTTLEKLILEQHQELSDEFTTLARELMEDEASIRKINRKMERYQAIIDSEEQTLDDGDKDRLETIKERKSKIEERVETTKTKIMALSERLPSNDKAMLTSHRKIMHDTGSPYWEQDVVSLLFHNKRYAWIQKASSTATARASTILDMTEPDFKSVFIKTLEIAPEDKKTRKLFDRKKVTARSIIIGSLIGSGFHLAKTLHDMNKHFTSAEHAENKGIEDKNRAYMIFVNVIPKALVDVAFLSSSQLRWRYRDVRLSTSPARSLRRILIQGISAIPRSKAADAVLLNLLRTETIAPSWFPKSMRDEMQGFLTRLYLIGQKAGINIDEIPHITESLYYKNLNRLLSEVKELSQALADKDTYLSALRNAKGVVDFRSATVLKIAKGRAPELKLKHRRFDRDVRKDPARGREFMKDFIRYTGIVPDGYIEKEMFKIADAANEEWAKAFAVKMISKVEFRPKDTPRIIKDLFKDDKILKARLKSVDAEQEVIINRLRKLATTLSEKGAENRSGLIKLREAAAEELSTDDKTAQQFLDRFDITLEHRSAVKTIQETPYSRSAKLDLMINVLYRQVLLVEPEQMRKVLLSEAGLPEDWLTITQGEIVTARRERLRAAGEKVITRFSTTQEEADRLQDLLSIPSRSEELRSEFRAGMKRIITDDPEGLTVREKFTIMQSHVLGGDLDNESLYDTFNYQWFSESDDSDVTLSEISEVLTLFQQWRAREYRSEDQVINQKLRERVITRITEIPGYAKVLKNIGRTHKFNADRWLETSSMIIGEEAIEDIEKTFEVDDLIERVRARMVRDANYSREIRKLAAIHQFDLSRWLDDPTLILQPGTLEAIDELSCTARETTILSGDAEEDDLTFDFTHDIAEEHDPDDDMPLVGSNPPSTPDSGADTDDIVLPPSTSEIDTDADPSSPDTGLAQDDDDDSMDVDPPAQLAHPDLAAEYEEMMDDIVETVVKSEVKARVDLGDQEIIILSDDEDDTTMVIVIDDSDDDEEGDDVVFIPPETDAKEAIIESILEEEDAMGDMEERQRLVDELKPKVHLMLQGKARLILQDKTTYPRGSRDILNDLGLPTFNIAALARGKTELLSERDLTLFQNAMQAHENRDSESEDDDEIFGALVGAGRIHGVTIDNYVPQYKPNALIV